MSALDRHPNAEIEQRLQVLRRLGWKIVKNKYGTFYDITCKAGTMNTRISASMGKNKRERAATQQVLGDFLIRHAREHPGEK